jgi:hypothetical protein
MNINKAKKEVREVSEIIQRVCGVQKDKMKEVRDGLWSAYNHGYLDAFDEINKEKDKEDLKKLKEILSTGRFRGNGNFWKDVQKTFKEYENTIVNSK